MTTRRDGPVATEPVRGTATATAVLRPQDRQTRSSRARLLSRAPRVAGSQVAGRADCSLAVVRVSQAADVRPLAQFRIVRTCRDGLAGLLELPDSQYATLLDEAPSTHACMHAKRGPRWMLEGVGHGSGANVIISCSLPRQSHASQTSPPRFVLHNAFIAMTTSSDS